MSLSLETLSSNVANNTELGGGHCRLRKGHVHRLSRTGDSLILLLGGKRWDLADFVGKGHIITDFCRHSKELVLYSKGPESRGARNERVRITFYKEHLHCVMESKLESQQIRNRETSSNSGQAIGTTLYKSTKYLTHIRSLLRPLI